MNGKVTSMTRNGQGKATLLVVIEADQPPAEAGAKAKAEAVGRFEQGVSELRHLLRGGRAVPVRLSSAQPPAEQPEQDEPPTAPEPPKEPAE